MYVAFKLPGLFFLSRVYNNKATYNSEMSFKGSKVNALNYSAIEYLTLNMNYSIMIKKETSHRRFLVQRLQTLPSC